MKHIAAVAMVSLLAACSSQNKTTMNTGLPGLNVAHAALEGGSPAVALNVSDAILVKNPKDTGALLSKADALVMLNRLGEAESAYTTALTINPGSVPALIGLARLNLRTDPVQAQAMFLDVVRRQPHNTVALNDLGIAYDLQGNHRAAQDAYRKALGLDPNLRATEVNLALSMALSGHAQAAVRMLRPAAADPDASRRVRHDLAAALELSGDHDSAASVLGADLSPEQVQQALHAYDAFGT
jgi:Flp pilus assembly protein TadD